MDVTTMPSINLLINQLKKDYPQFHFKESSRFLWSPSEKTVYYTGSTKQNSFLLHELSHGLLDHVEYTRDVELIAMERAAWDKAIEIGRDYDVIVSDDTIESTLDSYRDWLHARSTCPNCQANGLQVKQKLYNCLACGHLWRINEARICALRRYSI